MMPQAFEDVSRIKENGDGDDDECKSKDDIVEENFEENSASRKHQKEQY